MGSTLTNATHKIPDAIIDIRYGSSNNIAKKPLYKHKKILLLPEAAKTLASAANKLRRQGYRIVIWDTYRPPEVQEILREICSDNRYVHIDSNHCRGISVDLSLTDPKGKYLDMGTDFDEFCEKAHLAAPGLTVEQKNNRDILAKNMVAAGFTQTPYEWWHFDYLSLGQSGCN